MDIPKEVETLLSPLLIETGVELVDVEWRGEPVGWVLRLIIDKPGGISLEECASLNHRGGEIIENACLITRSYSMEVSSPGTSRPIKKRVDFERFMGNAVVIKTHHPLNNQKNFRGCLTSLEGELLGIQDRTSGIVRIELSNILRAHLDPDI